MLHIFWKFSRSQYFTLRSVEPQARVNVDGLYSKQPIECFDPGACYGSSLIILPVSSSQTLTAPSAPLEEIHLPSGEIATSRTASVCPLKVNIAYEFPALVSQILTVESALEVAIILFCSSYAMLVIFVRWPLSMFGFWVVRSQQYTDPPSVPAKSWSAWRSNAIQHALEVWSDKTYNLLLFARHLQVLVWFLWSSTSERYADHLRLQGSNSFRNQVWHR